MLVVIFVKKTLVFIQEHPFTLFSGETWLYIPSIILFKKYSPIPHPLANIHPAVSVYLVVELAGTAVRGSEWLVASG